MDQKSLARQTSREDLYDLVWSMPLGTIAARFGLTSNGLAKLCDRLAIPRPPRSYWMRQSQGVARPALPPAPEGVNNTVLIGGQRSTTRRPRTRLSLADRQQQLMDMAATIALTSGIHDVTLKRVARECGISETQAHNCFGGRIDLLVALTRREIAAVESNRRQRVARGGDSMARIVISTVSYLHEAAERGPLLQLLLRNAEVRKSLRDERAQATSIAREPILRTLSARNGMKREVANGSTAALTAVCLRAGGLVASGRVTLAVAERICLSVVMAGSRSNHALADGMSG